LIACMGDAGEETAKVVIAGVFTGGATIVGIGDIRAGDGNGLLSSEGDAAESVGIRLSPWNRGASTPP